MDQKLTSEDRVRKSWRHMSLRKRITTLRPETVNTL